MKALIVTPTLESLRIRFCCLSFLLVLGLCFCLLPHLCVRYLLSEFSFGFGALLLSVITLMCALVAEYCLTLCDPMDCSPPGSSVHGILQARILEWVAIPFSWGSSQLRDQMQVSCIAGGFCTV